MARSYYSTVFEQTPDEVWAIVRDFNNYPRYIEGVTESVIEDDKRGDEVGAVRRFRYGGEWIRQRLAAHSDADRSFTYAGIDQFSFPAKQGADAPAPIDYEGTLRLTPIIDGDRTFVEWFVDFQVSRTRPRDGRRSFCISFRSGWIPCAARSRTGVELRETLVKLRMPTGNRAAPGHRFHTRRASR